jgi:serine/threonine protein kinase
MYKDSLNIIHRDLKPNNIFINGPNLVIGDLGHAKKFENSVSKKSFSFRFGTLPYNSPESIESGNNENYSNKIDIWLVYYKNVFVIV